MRDYGKVWTDFAGRTWPVVASARRLKFKYPAHAALRAHVHFCDGYACLRCGVKALSIPDGYSGRYAIEVDRVNPNGWRDSLVLDHILTLRAGGCNVAENLQTLCETCNRRKQREDRRAIREYEASKP